MLKTEREFGINNLLYIPKNQLEEHEKKNHLQNIHINYENEIIYYFSFTDEN